ncbi:hypothetical protein SAMN05216436_12842 [bacterium A37T11]|nr:hypothetical protein SAMN05216436_12842 [bacterium A37T11]
MVIIELVSSEIKSFSIYVDNQRLICLADTTAIGGSSNLAAGHWLPLERKAELAETISSWVKAKGLKAGEYNGVYYDAVREKAMATVFVL